MKYRGIFEYEYPTEHKPPVSIDVHLHGDCVKGKIIEWEYRQLDQESTPKNDLGVDCISREDVLMCLTGEFENREYELSELIKIFLKRIKALPSVTPQEPKTGHWMGDSYGYICSNCEHSLNDLAQSMDYISFSKPKYCPNCGADMREVEE